MTRTRRPSAESGAVEHRLANLARAFSGHGYAHAPTREPVDLDALVQADADDDRWNAPGEPTAYLALDPGVALAEFARHQPRDATDAERRLIRLDLQVPAVIDLRDAAVLTALRVDDAPIAFLDRARSRELARRIRAVRAIHALLVPSVAFLDDQERCNLVVFGDRDPSFRSVVQRCTEIGRLEIDDRPRQPSPRSTGR